MGRNLREEFYQVLLEDLKKYDIYKIFDQLINEKTVNLNGLINLLEICIHLCEYYEKKEMSEQLKLYLINMSEDAENPCFYLYLDTISKIEHVINYKPTKNHIYL
jgi:hypothetical protein